MTLQFGEDTLIAEARGTAMNQRFGKTCLGQQLCCFQGIEQGLDIVAILCMTRQLSGQLQPTVFTSG